MNANGQYKINTAKKAKTTEKLSSGYRINRAADDASGLAISEKMRRQIRGLNQGTSNARDGVSWVQTGDGALNEAHDILHRMTELSVKALNETYTDDDREIMQAEFDHLQSELDRLTGSATFNEKHIFQEHETPYYQFEGNAVWLQNQRHVITDGANDLIVEYRLLETDPPVTKKITVPAGVYTTQALIDEIDTALEDAGLIDEGIVFEYTESGRCNLNLEGGEKIDNISGGLSYLLYDSFGGGSLGALIGTTIFPTDNSRLLIADGYNDEMSFTVVNTDGSSHPVSLKIPAGNYNRSELLNLLQKELDKTPGNTIKATEHGTGIKLASDESIITGFKGNMFQIDTGDFAYTSVFYDNVQESRVDFTPGSFTGAAILPVKDSQYPENICFDIRTGVNDTLVLKPNGAAQETIITIPEKQYDMNEMITFLNGKMGSLGLSASSYSDGNFQGITIESAKKGVTSTVGLVQDKCTAYDTLFVRHEYKVPGLGAACTNEKIPDRTAELRSGRGITLPLSVQAGKNDQFLLTINGNSYTITLDEDTYQSLNEIKNALDKQLNGNSAPASYKGLLSVKVDLDNRIWLEGDRSVNSINVGNVKDNTGYEAIFVGKELKFTSSPAQNSTTTNTPVLQDDGTVKITDSQKNLGVLIDGAYRPITLPVGDHVTQQDIIAAINKQLGDQSEENKFNDINRSGDNKNLHFNVPPSDSNLNGQPAHFNGQGKYEGDPQGIAGGTQKSTPATVTISKALPEKITIAGSNKHFACTLNGLGGSPKKDIAFDLSEKTYTRNDLVAELQAQINAQCKVAPDQYGGLKVSLDSSNRLVFTAGLLSNGAEVRGDTTQFQSSPAMSSFLGELYRQPASITLNRSINYPVDFGSGQTFSFLLQKPSGSLAPVSVTLTGSYSNGTALANHISNQLSAAGIPVKASISYGGNLTLTTTENLKGYQLSFDSKDAGSATETMFGDVPPGGGNRKLEYTTAATATIGQKVEDRFDIDDTHNTFSIEIDGDTKTATLPPKAYTIDTLITELNSQLGSWVTVGKSSDGKYLRLTTTSTNGTNSKIHMKYDTGGSSMIRIFGETIVPGATASFDKDGHLVLTRNAPGGNVQVNSNSGGPFQLPTTETSDPTKKDGRHSDLHSYIQGTPVILNGNNKVAINQWNKDLTLWYNSNYTGYNHSYTSKSVTLKEGEYTLSELAAALETALGSEFHVLEKDGGIRIESAKPGSTFRFQTVSDYPYQPPGSGGFYHKILCSPAQNVQAGTAKDFPGKQTVLPAYVMGRKDIKHQTTNIQKGVNDGLGMEFTLGSKTYPLSMTLDPGSYSSDDLLKQVQEKLDDELVKNGLPKGLIQAGIGGFSTGVAGSDDANALHFILSSTVPLPSSSAGRCVIEAVSGTAAFSIFYQTEGDISRAYVEGTRDLSQGILITDDNRELSVKVDNDSYTIQIPPKADGGIYTPQELASELNKQFKDGSVPLSASIEDGRLQLMHTKFGPHTIGNISGSAKNSLFFIESGNKEKDSGIPIQLSSAQDDQIRIDRPILSTASMRINSVLISRTKYASKAIDRLKSATRRVSEVRSYFGSMQNRLGHAINNNENKAENTAAAESAIRDTNMSKELVTHMQQNILEQAGIAMIAQANQIPRRVLELLS